MKNIVSLFLCSLFIFSLFLPREISSFFFVLLFFDYLFNIKSKNFTVRLEISFFIFFAYILILFFFKENGNFIVVEHHLSYFLFPLYFLLSKRKPNDFYLIIVFICFTLLANILCLINAIYLQLEYDLSHINWFYFTYHDFTRIIKFEPYYLSLYSGFSVILAVNIFFKRKKILYLFVVSLFVLFQLLITTRIIIFSTFSVLVLIFFRNLTRKQFILSSTLVFLAFIFVTSLNPYVRARLLSSYFDMNLLNKTLAKNWGSDSGKYNDRTIKWESAINVAKCNLLFGVPFFKYKDYLVNEYKRINYKVGVDRSFDPHNQYLSYLVVFGIVGLLLFLTVLFKIFYFSYYSSNYLLFYVTIFFMLSFITESTLFRQKGIVLFIYFTLLISRNSNFSYVK